MYDADGKDDIGVLKSLLPVMSRHASGYHPISYTVWFEYSAGSNKSLKLDVDAELQHVERLTAIQTYSLYVKHLVDPAERAVMSARTNLIGLVADVKGKVLDAEAKTVGFDNQLTRFQDGVAKAKSLTDLNENIATMLVETKKVSETFGKITNQLEETRKEAQRLAEELRNVREEALTDSLSGLFNRRGFDVELERIANRQGGDHALAVIMIDIDNFKSVNDTYGHPFGDLVITAVGQFIRGSVGVIGVASRYGGEEFAVLLPNLTLGEAERIAEGIRARVEQGKVKRRKDDEAIGGITISAGVAAWRTGEDTATLVERADVALYAAKRAGRNRVVVEP